MSGLLFVPRTFKSGDEIVWCYHLKESSMAVLSHGTIDFVKYTVLTFESVDENPMVLPFKRIVYGSTFTWYYRFS